MEVGLISTLLNRGYVVSSSWSNFHSEVNHLMRILGMNGYTLSFIYYHIKRFLNHKFSLRQAADRSDVHVSVNMIKIPYIGLPSIILKKKIKQAIKKINTEYIISCVFYTPKLGNYFSPKDPTPLPLRAGVIYQFTCEVDPRLSYIGKTKRHLLIRIREHKTSASTIHDHVSIFHCFSPNNFSVLKHCNNDYEANIFEALYIKFFVPTLSF